MDLTTTHLGEGVMKSLLRLHLCKLQALAHWETFCQLHAWPAPMKRLSRARRRKLARLFGRRRARAIPKVL